MNHVFLFILGMCAMSFVTLYLEYVRVKFNWERTGDLIVTHRTPYVFAVFVWSAILLFKVMPGIPAC